MDFIKVNHLKEIAKFKNSKQKIYFLAGGTDLMVQYKEKHLPENAIIIDISSLKNLNYINETKVNIKIGALTSFTDIIENNLIKQYYKALNQAAQTIGSVQIRNRATIGGNISNASPAGDSIPALYIYQAKIKTNFGIYPIAQVFKGVKKTKLKNGEIIIEILLPKEGKKYNSFFFKSSPRQALAISKASLAVKILKPENKIKDIKIAAGAVGITVLKIKKTEQYLINKEITKETVNKAKQIIKNEIFPIDDFRSTKFYRLNFIAESLEEALKGSGLNI